MKCLSSHSYLRWILSKLCLKVLFFSKTKAATISGTKWFYKTKQTVKAKVVTSNLDNSSIYQVIIQGNPNSIPLQYFNKETKWILLRAELYLGEKFWVQTNKLTKIIEIEMLHYVKQIIWILNTLIRTAGVFVSCLKTKYSVWTILCKLCSLQSQWTCREVELDLVQLHCKPDFNTSYFIRLHRVYDWIHIYCIISCSFKVSCHFKNKKITDRMLGCSSLENNLF